MKQVLLFFAHALVALSIPFAANLSLSVDIAPRAASRLLTENPFFPVQILFGLFLGFQLMRRFKHKVMLWIWIVPAMILLIAILFMPLRPLSVSGRELTRIQHFFGWSCLPPNRCYEQLAITLLFYSGAAYSLGALLAQRTPARRRI